MREIFLIDLRGTQYGVWKDEILSVEDIAALHLIPFSPARIAGIMMVDGQTVTLADLAVCLGYPPAPTLSQGGIFIMGTDKKLTGFVVGGQIETQSISAELILPIPEYLRTPLFDSCVVHDNRTIPLIKLSELYSRALQGDAEFAAAEHANFPVQAQDVASIEKIRFFTVRGDLFAASASGIGNSAVSPGTITPLPNTPGYVKGITCRDGHLLPVVDLPQRIKSESAPPNAPMLIAELAGSTFGLLVDVDGITLPAKQVKIKPLPKITRTAWMKHAVVREGEIIPLVDLAMALSPGAPDEIANRESYTPASGFPEKFFRQDVEVVEFSLLGERHALPKDEVENIIAYKPCRPLPDEPNVVIGVAEHNGEILPVLDPAMMYGRCSITTPAWRMIVLNNGDFRALVLTETVYAERKLKVDSHRAVPIHLPHHLLYGCYPDENAARIILNIEAIAERLEKSLIQKFLPALSPEMKIQSKEVGVAASEVQADVAAPVPEAAPAVGAGEMHAAAPALPAAAGERSAGQPAQVQDTAAKVAATSAAEQQAIPVNDEADEAEKMQRFTRSLQLLDDAFAEWKKDDTAVAATAPSKASPRKAAQDKASPGTAATPALAAQQTSRDAAASASAPADRTAEKIIGAAPEQKIAAPLSPAAQRAAAPETMATSAATPDRAALQPVAGEARKAAAAAVAGKPPEAPIQPAPQPAAPPAYSAPVKPVPPAEIPAPYQVSTQAGPRAVLRGHQGPGASSRRRAMLYAAAAIVLLAALFYYAGYFGEGSRVSGSAAPSAGQAAPAQAASAKQPAAPLELVIPKSRPPVDVEVYVVVQGDTLWDIAERFTGDPFNYPRIAGENKVADPDMIYPGQRIRLVK